MSINKYIKWIILGLIIVAYASCYRDNSTEPKDNTAKLSIRTNTLQERYEMEFEEILSITPPKVDQNGQNKQLSYVWEINYKVVSTDEVLRYKCDEYGVLPGRLTIKNEDSYLFIPFEVEVFYPYSIGLYALAEHQGETILSFLPTSEHRGFDIDVLRRYNPDTHFGTKPMAVFFMNYAGVPLAYVSTDKPNKVYRLEPNTMVMISELDGPRADHPIEYMVNSGNELPIWVVEGDRWAELKRDEKNFENGAYRNMRDEKPGGGFNVAPRILYCYGVYHIYLNSRVFYDNLNGRFIVRPETDFQAIALFGETFKGYQLVDMGIVDRGQSVVAVLTHPEKGLKTVYFSPGTYVSMDSQYPAIAAIIKDQQVIKPEYKLTKSSIIATNPKSNLLYYSNGNAVYAYNVQSQGNFPAVPSFTLGDGEAIADMIISQDQSKLYIATNKAGEELPGSVYCFNAEDNKTLLWSKKNVTGTIVQLAERTF